MVPNYLTDVQQAKELYPVAWSHAHVSGDPKAWDFIRLLAADLHAQDQNVGLNGKRGNPHDLSMDALNYLDPEGPGRTPDGEPCWVIDCIVAAGSDDAAPGWNVQEDPVASSGAWVQPGAWVPPPPTEPPPPTQPTYPTYEDMGGDEAGKAVTRLMETDYQTAGKAGLDGDSGPWQWRTAYDYLTGVYATVDESIAAHQPEWREALNAERISQGKPPIVW